MQTLTYSFILLLTISLRLAAQDTSATNKPSNTGSIQGRILDVQSEKIIYHGSIELYNFSPPLIAHIDSASGEFNLKNIPMGRHRLLAHADGYEDKLIPDIIVVSGKDVYLTITLQEIPKMMPDPLKPVLDSLAKITPNPDQELIPIETAVAEQHFTLEEVNRFSGSRNDLARLVTSYAGTINSDDTRNDLIVRGATPLGIQWMMEGIPIINPNHFAALGTTSGAFPIINTNTLDASDFRLGCFAGQFGNSTAGILDLRMRNGSISHWNTTVQMSLINGAELMLDIPMFNKKASLVVSGRYSLLNLVNKIPFVFKFNSPTLPTFYDINFKFNVQPSRFGEFSLFGFVGSSNYNASQDSVSTFVTASNADVQRQNFNAFIGMKYRLFIGQKTYWQTTLGANVAYGKMQDDYYRQPIDTLDPTYRGLYSTILNGAYSFSSFVNTKFSPRVSMRHGVLAQYLQYELFEMENKNNIFPQFRHNFIGGSMSFQAYSNLQLRVTKRFTFDVGAHLLYYLLNHNYAVEPRAGMSIQISKKQYLHLAYTMQHQILSSRLYFLRLLQIDALNGTSTYDESARQLKFMGNHYATLEYVIQFNSFWQLKLAPYYRLWFGIPVQANGASGYSLFNADGSLPNYLPNVPLQSTGTAQNYGVDVTLQKYFNKGFHLIWSGSYFRSLYKGSDDTLRQSRFDRQFISRLRLGHEFAIGKEKRNTFFLSSTFTIAGGERYTPIDTLQSTIFNQEILTQRWFSQHTPMYWRWDFKIGFQINARKRRMNHYFYLDIMNVTDKKNLLMYQYNVRHQAVEPVYQFGRLPELLYRLQF